MRLYSTLISLCFCLVTPSFVSAQHVGEVYDLLRALEDEFPAPPQLEDFDIGTFDASNGSFQGKKTLIITVGHKPRVIKPQVTTNALRVRLKFKVANRVGRAVVTVNNIPHYSTSDEITVTVDARQVREFRWRINSNNRTYSDTLLINRQPFPAVGAFELPLLPTGIIYDLPNPVSRESKIEYTFTKSHTVEMRFSSTTTETRESEDFPTFLSGVTEFQEMVGKAITVAKALHLFKSSDESHPLKIAEALNGALAALVGSVDATKTEGSVEVHENSLKIVTSEAHVFGPSRQGGPGKGDVLGFILSPRFGWVFDNGRLHLVLLDHKGTGTVNLRDVAAMKSFGWDDATIRALQNLDPFMSDPNAVLDEGRFQKLLTISGLSKYGYKKTYAELRSDKATPLL